MKATPKPYVLIVTGEGPACVFELWADDRLYAIANMQFPALRRLADVTSHEKATSARYALNPRWDAAEVEAELREQLDAAVAASGALDRMGLANMSISDLSAIPLQKVWKADDESAADDD